MAMGCCPSARRSRVSDGLHVSPRPAAGAAGARARPPATAPLANPALRAAAPLPAAITNRWPNALAWLDAGSTLADLPIDHRVAPRRCAAARRPRGRACRRSLPTDLTTYGTERNQPERDVTSGLSPYLHWGHLSAHEVFAALMAREGWLGDLPSRATGSREGWWGVGPEAEGFLDELVTWRELGFNMSARGPTTTSTTRYPTGRRARSARTPPTSGSTCYDLDAFEEARTHDPLWNAAQRQLVSEGRIHNYLRMLWGKKILQWAASPREALAIMIALNNTYALDGRDPNSYSGIFWVLGRYDRPWFPERPVFGVVRYMSSENTARKVRVKGYMRRYGGGLFQP